MKLHWQTHSVPKAGHRAEENEDAIAFTETAAAVCDGASEGWGSGVWARHLAEAFVLAPVQPAELVAWLANGRATAPVAGAVQAWYAEEKQAQGAFSTLLGIRFSDTQVGGVRYHAVAVGDTVLIHLRGNAILASFPIETSSEFTNRPALVGSVDTSGEPAVQWFAGRAEAGDRFLLLSDALAEWFLHTAEAGGMPWQRLEAVTSMPAEFAGWVQSLRAKKLLKNDDTTAVRVRVY